ncbi:MAG: crossover junction endodeoxyribonuclease RuvC [Gammaproteobacteria bacterium]|nr:crossover junction endodeoxyribonuclease RuvC [Gammaproteobacteria bacterium]
MIRILGIDPGSRLTGFGIIEVQGNRLHCLATGCVKINGENLASKLKIVFEGISELVSEYQPQEVAIENIFMYRNAESALKLGQARGAAISAVSVRSIPVHEYTPSEIKKAVVGKGNASKEQVQHMIRALLSLNRMPQSDAADALAVAVCHANRRNQPLPLERRRRAGRWKSLS